MIHLIALTTETLYQLLLNIVLLMSKKIVQVVLR